MSEDVWHEATLDGTSSDEMEVFLTEEVKAAHKYKWNPKSASFAVTGAQRPKQQKHRAVANIDHHCRHVPRPHWNAAKGGQEEDD